MQPQLALLGGEKGSVWVSGRLAELFSKMPMRVTLKPRHPFSVESVQVSLDVAPHVPHAQLPLYLQRIIDQLSTMEAAPTVLKPLYDALVMEAKKIRNAQHRLEIRAKTAAVMSRSGLESDALAIFNDLFVNRVWKVREVLAVADAISSSALSLKEKGPLFFSRSRF